MYRLRRLKQQRAQFSMLGMRVATLSPLAPVRNYLFRYSQIVFIRTGAHCARRCFLNRASADLIPGAYSCVTRCARACIAFGD